MTVATAKAAPPRKGSANKWLILLGAVPAVAVIGVFVGVPFVQTIQLAFSEWNGAGPVNFVGLENFIGLLASADFWQVMGRTAAFSLGATAGILVIGTLLSAAIASGVPGARFFRSLWFLPVVVPVSAAGVYWGAALQPRGGVVNAALTIFGGEPVAFLSDPALALPTITLVWIWIHTGFAMLLILGAMNLVPVEVYEAARVDGAGPVHQFFAITLPIIRPTLVTVAMLELIITFNGFAIVWAMTRGGPGSATEILAVDVYRTAFEQGGYGAASAAALLGTIGLLVVGLIGLRGMRSSSE